MALIPDYIPEWRMKQLEGLRRYRLDHQPSWEDIAVAMIGITALALIVICLAVARSLLT
jgi:hypothetical protein